MSSSVTIKGVSASLRWGYSQAATLRDYTVTKTPGGWSVSATVVSSDAFRVSQRPLAFIVPHADGEWQWPITTLQIEGASLNAALGPKE
jgi:hypothetical protein